MDLNTYQEKALTTAVYPAPGSLLALWYNATGLAGESGETLDKVKKLVRVAEPTDLIDPDKRGSLMTYAQREAIKKELGDVMWYLAMASWELGLTLEEVAAANIAKLSDRKDQGTLTGEGDDR